MARGKGDGAAKGEKKEKEAAQSSKAPKQQQPASPAKAPTKRAARDEIDDIFSSKPAAKKGKAGGDAAAGADGGAAAAAAAAAAPEDAKALSEVADMVKEARQKAKRPKVEGSKDDIFGDSAAKGRKKTEEGFAIYTEDELGLGRRGGGDTDLCPFDCECCY